MLVLALFAVVSVAAVIGTLVVTVRDGYGRSPFAPIARRLG